MADKRPLAELLKEDRRQIAAYYTRMAKEGNLLGQETPQEMASRFIDSPFGQARMRRTMSDVMKYNKDKNDCFLD